MAHLGFDPFFNSCFREESEEPLPESDDDVEETDE
jgi:hypothetical protein